MTIVGVTGSIGYFIFYGFMAFFTLIFLLSFRYGRGLLGISKGWRLIYMLQGRPQTLNEISKTIFSWYPNVLKPTNESIQHASKYLNFMTEENIIKKVDEKYSLTKRGNNLINWFDIKMRNQLITSFFWKLSGYNYESYTLLLQTSVLGLFLLLLGFIQCWIVLGNCTLNAMKNYSPVVLIFIFMVTLLIILSYRRIRKEKESYKNNQ